MKKVFLSKVAVFSVVGAIVGVLGIDYPTGISLILFLTILVGFIFILTGKTQEYLSLGKVYREGEGTAILGFFLFWILAMNLVSGCSPSVYVVHASKTGAWPIQEVNGKIVHELNPPGFNASYVVLKEKTTLFLFKSEDVVDMWLGYQMPIPPKGEPLRVNCLNFSIENGSVSFSFNANATEGGSEIIKGPIKKEGTQFLVKLGQSSVTVQENSSNEIRLGNFVLEVSSRGDLLMFELRGVPLSSDPVDLSSYGLNILVMKANGTLFIFTDKPSRISRTARVDDKYIVVLPS